MRADPLHPPARRHHQIDEHPAKRLQVSDEDDAHHHGNGDEDAVHYSVTVLGNFVDAENGDKDPCRHHAQNNEEDDHEVRDAADGLEAALVLCTWKCIEYFDFFKKQIEGMKMGSE